MDWKWIWLDPARWPDAQRTRCSQFCKDEPLNFRVAQFRRAEQWNKTLSEVVLSVCADSRFRFWLNGEYVGSGPVWSGCDYGFQTPPPKRYANRFVRKLSGNQLRIEAEVAMGDMVCGDCSWGQGGFLLNAELLFTDGSRAVLVTDSRWEARLATEYRSPEEVDWTIPEEPWLPAAVVSSVEPEIAPIPELTEVPVAALGSEPMVVNAGETREFRVEFDRIYSGPIQLNLHAPDGATVTVENWEVERKFHAPERMTLCGERQFRSWRLHSSDHWVVTVENTGALPVEISNPEILFTHYPDDDQSVFRCSDPGLEKVYDVCKWTLRLCRQSIHLDSQKHQEPLGCTGDYFVQSWMTYATFGDTKLIRLDLIRTADLLLAQEGKMFHTSYSLIWVQMLYDYYAYTGDLEILRETAEARSVLMRRFRGYLGENGVLEYAPDYMFVDWMTCEGYSMHHPPKAFGQAVLNAFYARALTLAERICRILGEKNSADEYSAEGKRLKAAFREEFCDFAQKRVLGGLATPDRVPLHAFLPANTDHTVPSLHAAVLAALYGLLDEDEAKEILRASLQDASLVQMQPYFMHFALDAVAHCGLFEEFGMQLLRRWIPVVEDCEKGLAEGWYKPQADYSFDHSHAWGGTPAYQLPYRLLGLRILEPGCRKIALRPCLYGLDWAEIRVSTPLGMLSCTMKQGQKPEVLVPDGICVVWE